METKNIFLIVLIVVLAYLFFARAFETFVDGSYDITMQNTTGMDYSGSFLSKLFSYPNNLNKPTKDTLDKIKMLQNYDVQKDGPTTTNWVSDGMKVIKNIDSPDNREEFTMMNPFVSNH
jgi:hypothetical protein